MTGRHPLRAQVGRLAWQIGSLAPVRRTRRGAGGWLAAAGAPSAAAGGRAPRPVRVGQGAARYRAGPVAVAQEQLGERIRVTAGVPAEQLRVRRLLVRGRARLRQRAPGVAARLVVFRGRPPVVPRRQDSAWRVQLDPFTMTLKISAWNLLG